MTDATQPERVSLNESIATLQIQNADKLGVIIPKPENPDDIAIYRKAANRIVADRLIRARNRTHLNNEKINKLLHAHYVRRGRNAKPWLFTNILNGKVMALPDGEETDMIAETLGIKAEILEIHLRTMPWVMEKKPKATTRVRNPRNATEMRSKAQTPEMDARDESVDKRQANGRQWHADPYYTQNTTPWPEPHQDGGGRDTGHEVEHDETGGAMPIAGEVRTTPSEEITEAGTIKISHDGRRLQISGKLWCDRATASKLRLIVPITTIHHGRGAELSAYEVRGPIQPYQLYNLMHIVYGAPLVTAVDLESGKQQN